ncbi:hypothetical protein L226DRAFT_571724 [Lentinus tigrinus ALCF2SS1-7]|uniref:uncharacterized protein n=1 Tax=Lentinus tigrinus ALCF2SS1-7 TaxID=1328758 RepID=UPI0011661373|nr:hypothetical protein L226DRAFT_571724 [Lentinus tigrinus ALCF2SS1-7]
MPLVGIDFGVLHSKTEALIGILLSSNDSRAKGVLEDLAEDPLAKEIINHVDNSSYGYKGRSSGIEAPTSRTRVQPDPREGDSNVMHATHPSNEWQDEVIKRLNSAAHRNTLLPDDQVASRTVEDVEDEHEHQSRPSTMSQNASASSSRGKNDDAAQSRTSFGDSRRQRRRLDEPLELGGLAYPSPSSTCSRRRGGMVGAKVSGGSPRRGVRPSTAGCGRPGAALGTLLRILHPVLPIVHKPTFVDDWHKGNRLTDSPYLGESGCSDAASSISSSHLGPRRWWVPTLLLLAMFSLAARYSPSCCSMPI